MAKKYKMTRKQLEDKVRQLELEPYEPTPERVEEIKQRAFEMYEREINAKKKLEEKKAEKKGRRRRVVVVAALTVAFLLISFVYNAVTPMTVANANSFMKRAVIWINDKLHLGIEFETPLDDQSIDIESSHSYSSIRELAYDVNSPIIFLNETESVSLKQIDIINDHNENASIVISYEVLGGIFRIRIEQMYNNSIVYVNSEEIEILKTAYGEMTIWQSDNIMKGILYYNSYAIDIVSTLQKEDFIRFCQVLQAIN